MKDTTFLGLLCILALLLVARIVYIEKYEKLTQEITPINPYVVTTALDERNALEVKRTVRDTVTIAPFGLTGGLHKEKIKLNGSWFRT